MFIVIKSIEIEKVMKNTTRQYFVGNLSRPQKIENIKDERLEMGISSYSHDKIEPAHFHTHATEFQYMIKGWTEYRDIQSGEIYTFKEGDFFAILPGTPYLQKVKAGTKILFVKTPSINDKNIVKVNDEYETWAKTGLQIG